MTSIIEARNLSKKYGKFQALDAVDFTINSGQIVGLIGPNGAGKTTALKALLGLTNFDGDLKVCGIDPRTDRHKLMQEVSFIADVAVLPGWMKVCEAIEFVEGVHPAFNRDKAMEMLALTKIPMKKKVKQLSKGMVTQLHLALVLAIDAKILVLDEPTLGLDILYRKAFYDHLLNDYFSEDRTIIITTHQVDEIEYLLTDLLFINDGKIVLDIAMDEIQETYLEVMVAQDQVAAARDLKPITEREVFGRFIFLFENVDREVLDALGEVHVPKVTDLFVAKMTGAAA
ncbi:MAG: multidrug ABC transporter ATP-binding protein [Gammaproteobacteria bacterium]|nr:MAG: multidrug ABC transporter ATP-binding protein [Gammaproteobacteria bacterium]